MLHRKRVNYFFHNFLVILWIPGKLECGQVPQNPEYDESEDKESESEEITESRYEKLFITWPSCFSVICFVALRPKSTAMDIARRSVHLTTLFPGQA